MIFVDSVEIIFDISDGVDSSWTSIISMFCSGTWGISGSATFLLLGGEVLSGSDTSSVSLILLSESNFIFSSSTSSSVKPDDAV